MNRSLIQTVLRFTLVAALAFLAGCGTLAYRSVQDNFVDAVEADNAWSTSPFGANAAEGIYRDVHSTLTSDYIAELDPRLHANAWLLRAVSAWRIGDFNDARSAANNGRTAAVAASQNGSRDHVMLTMLDGLVIDSDLRARYDNHQNPLDLNAYQSTFEQDFQTALTSLDHGPGVAGNATPPETLWYYHYHRWRLIQNWRTVVNTLNDSDRSTAKAAAQGVLGNTFRATMNTSRDAIPANHPLHQLILALGG